MQKDSVKKSGWNWGKGIFLMYTLFVIGIMLMVSGAFRQKIDLVAPDYYAQELAFQTQIDKIKRSNALEEPVKILVEKDRIVLDFPFAGDSIQGTVELFRPSNSDQDRKYSVNAGEDGLMQIPTSDLNPGAYRLKADWTHGGLAYFNEQVLVIQAKNE